ncbi:YciI family protein [Nesterenkonia ebinurensis]|uniref:YciI family protein n=1 Tax=Nesterenkonia ebinurensis TaxID=2608252 RepID=UPI00123D8984|nr:YciI family protein [Nesterenkonia ebinurensis]
MFLVLLRFGENKHTASDHLAGHNAWIDQGFADGVFLLVGSIQQASGGAVLAAGVSREELEHRVDNDPFVAEGVVTAEIVEIEPGRADDRLSFLLSGQG